MRHSCDKHSPTLYVSEGLDFRGRAFASEPLNGCPKNWLSVPEIHFSHLSAEELVMEQLAID